MILNHIHTFYILSYKLNENVMHLLTKNPNTISRVDSGGCFFLTPEILKIYKSYQAGE